jgi:TonB family protein
MRIGRLLNVRQPATPSTAAPIFLLLMIAASAIAFGSAARAESKPALVDVSVTSPSPEPAPAPQPEPAQAPALKPAPRPGPAPAVALVEPATNAPQQNGPQRIAGGVMAGAILSKTQPVYPDIAKAAHVSGAVVLHAIISPEGNVVNLQVISGPEMLRASALDAVQHWVYQPYLLNGEPTAVDTTITVNYNFSEDPKPAQNADAPRQIGGSVSAPVVLYTADPTYTAEARQAKLSGNVLVHLEVDTAGSPTNVRVVHGLGKGLDEQAVAAVEQYRFKPAMENGRPVAVEMNVEVTSSCSQEIQLQ